MLKKLKEYDVLVSVLDQYTIPIMVNGSLRQVSLGTLLSDVRSNIENESQMRENENAEMITQLEDVKNRADQTDLSLINFVDGGYVENGVAYFTNNGSVLFEITGIGGGGGGGGGGSTVAAVLTVTNTTGWLSKTISEGGECNVSFVWSSIEDDLPTGNGSMKIMVNNATVANLNIQQGNVVTDLSSYLGSGANNVKVQISDVYGQSRTINFSITVMAFSLSSSFDVSAPFPGQISFPYTPVGAVAKTVHFILDGNEIGTQVTSVTGRQMSYMIPAQTHGDHSLSVYFEATVNGENVRSNTLYYEFASLEAGVEDTVITSQFSAETEDQYTTLTIPYMVYKPSALTAEVMIYVNNNLISTQTVDRTEQKFTYRLMFAGPVVFEFLSGGTSKRISITVNPSEVDVSAETEALKLHLSSQGRSNQEEGRAEWTYDDIEASLTGFNWKSDGWQLDDDGVTVLRVSGDARVTIPYKPFANDFRATGKTIEIEFATRDVRDYDSVVLSCMSGGRGMMLTAQRAIIESEQSSISTQYKENEHIRIAFVCEKRSENRLLFIYINGIASGVVQYPADDDFSQVTPVNISIGNSNCTMDMYCIRVYDNDLDRFQIVDNWIADMQNGAKMLETFNHNNVFDTYGNIVISSLPEDLPYLILEAPELPQYKGDKKTCSGSFTNPAQPSKSFTFSGAQIDVQGTSSQYYPRKNYKVKFKNGFVLPNGNTETTYALNSSVVPTSAFCFKADVASSEGANNVELARLYNDACPYKTPAQNTNPKVRQGIDGFPMVIFWNNGAETKFLGKYNFNIDKGTEEVFGFVYPDESWEIKNNTGNRVLWKSADYTGTDWLNDFEARFPDTDPAYTDPAQLAEFAEWVMSTDTTAATDDELDEPVTYMDGEEEVTFTHDTAEYRLAKFKNEASDYMEMQSALFYYLFTELFLMVDSRAKNAFPSFIGGPL